VNPSTMLTSSLLPPAVPPLGVCLLPGRFENFFNLKIKTKFKIVHKLIPTDIM
jgi:hypothetical protein